MVLCNAYAAELWGSIYEGLLYARELGFTCIEVSVDSAIVVSELTNGGSGSPRGCSLVEMICCLMDLEWKVVLHHFFREANQRANVLAKLLCSI
ncbi:hypothetical protein TSUD_260760 [Trifolium subterraneum]|uniref:RNase H type-1 domain-containing protein n=1 Tax=Trifolium subterraneum TaxID=3900 RepID=A0A2Z6LU11_TRISU|nr:hypothetical protein TSUD_260760 [Trifolium subterraneum]